MTQKDIEKVALRNTGQLQTTALQELCRQQDNKTTKTVKQRQQ